MAVFLDDIAQIADLADQGNETAIAFMQWMFADSGAAEEFGLFPTDRHEQGELGRKVGHTAELFLAARCARYVMDHGVAPGAFNFKVSIEFENL